VAWWYLVFPALALLITTLVFNLLGDGIGDALDPGAARLPGRADGRGRRSCPGSPWPRCRRPCTRGCPAVRCSKHSARTTFGFVLAAAVFVIVANILVDIAYAMPDPRVRLT
jgi:hypothetical protein